MNENINIEYYHELIKPKILKRQLPPIKNNHQFSLSGKRVNMGNRFKMF